MASVVCEPITGVKFCPRMSKKGKLFPVFITLQMAEICFLNRTNTKQRMET